MSSVDLDERLDLIANDLLFHPHPVIENLLMDHDSVCDILKVNSRTLKRYVKRGLIRCEVIDGIAVYPVCQVDVLMKWIMMRRLARLVALT